MASTVKRLLVGTSKVYKLKKSLYGLKQALRYWNKKFTDLLTTFEFNTCELNYYLGLEVNISSDCLLKITQTSYKRQILQKFRMNDGKSVTTPI